MEPQRHPLGVIVHLPLVPELLALGFLPAVLLQSMTLSAPRDVGRGVPGGRAADAHLHTLGEVLGPGMDADLWGPCGVKSGRVGDSLSGQPRRSGCPAPSSSPSPKGLNLQGVAFLGTWADQAAAQATRGEFPNAPGRASSSLGFCSGLSILEKLGQIGRCQGWGQLSSPGTLSEPKSCPCVGHKLRFCSQYNRLVRLKQTPRGQLT